MTATVTKGKVVSLEYTLKLDDKQMVGTTVGKDPLTYTQGTNQIIRGVEAAVEGMTVGETKHVILAPADGYGTINPSAFQEVPKGKVPQDIKVGTQLHGKDAKGRTIEPIVSEIRDKTVLLNFNHPLAGKSLFLEMKVVNIS